MSNDPSVDGVHPLNVWLLIMNLTFRFVCAVVMDMTFDNTMFYNVNVHVLVEGLNSVACVI